MHLNPSSSWSCPCESPVGGICINSTTTNQTLIYNEDILSLCKILRNVMASAAEVEIGALFENSKAAVPLCHTLEEMGHPQPASPLQIDNSTASGIVNETIQKKRSKSIDMRFYWLKDCVRQGQFHMFWRPGPTNLANYHNKHHPASHHCEMRSNFLQYNALTSKTKLLNQITCEGVLIPPPVDR